MPIADMLISELNGKPRPRAGCWSAFRRQAHLETARQVHDLRQLANTSHIPGGISAMAAKRLRRREILRAAALETTAHILAPRCKRSPARPTWPPPTNAAMMKDCRLRWAAPYNDRVASACPLDSAQPSYHTRLSSPSTASAGWPVPSIYGPSADENPFA